MALLDRKVAPISGVARGRGVPPVDFGISTEAN
jgi:hypothetical protein